MHALHKILVRLSNCGRGLGTTRDDVLRYAESMTEEYYERAFDWRETDTAGRWEDEYRDNVMYAKDGIDKFISELEEVRKAQDKEKNFLLQMLKKETGTSDIEEIVHGTYSTMVGYYLESLAKLVNGTYCFDSMYYDTDGYTSLLSEERIEEIKKHPEDWALVFFDYHY